MGCKNLCNGEPVYFLVRVCIDCDFRYLFLFRTKQKFSICSICLFDILRALGRLPQNNVFISLFAVGSFFGDCNGVRPPQKSQINICLFAYLLIILYLFLSPLDWSSNPVMVGQELLLGEFLEIKNEV
ncbi:MAG: hypothetical protein UT58_C0005G0002 [Microgenomates group bacterium GW2011_GWC1_39_7b]|nr:MAG: hypothetical protein UT58_C0005G0002 [Microgenomates group bacterium GW2011_GWC1_39_7b]